MVVDRVEQAERQRAYRLLRRRAGIGTDGTGGEHGVGGGGEQFGLARDVPVDRPGPRRQPLGQRAERQSALAHRVQELDRGGDDALPGERFLPAFRTTRSACHAAHPKRPPPTSMERHSSLTVPGTTFHPR